jgi:uncharacterized repeat protein (TIGR01451 family)
VSPRYPAMTAVVVVSTTAILVLLWLLSVPNLPVTAKVATSAPSPRYVSTIGTDSGDCTDSSHPCRTVQYAVDQAGESSTIKVASGVYTDINNRAGLRQVVYISKTVIIQGGYTTNWSSSHPISYPTTLDAQGEGRVLYITGDISPKIEGLGITGGSANDLGGHTDQWAYTSSAGSGMYIITAAVTIRDSQIFGNRYASYGGGMYVLAAPADIRNNQIYSNTAMLGSGLYVKNSDVILDDNAITANTLGSGGSGLYLEFSNATLNGNTIAANAADQGGGVYMKHSNATLNSNIITGNSAFCWTPRFCDFRGGSGGGLYLYNSVASLNHNVIFSNTAGNEIFRGLGAGLYLEDSDATLSYNVISRNTARNGSYSKGLGAGLYLERSDAAFHGNTVAANVASFGGGMYIDRSSATIVNNLVVDNWASEEGSGLYVEGASPRLWHTTLAHNSGGGVYATSYSDGQTITHSTVLLTNTILVSHTVGIIVTAGNTATLEGTLWGAGVWANDFDWGGEGTVFTGTHNHWDNPAFVNPNAGDYHIGIASAAIDQGADTGVYYDIDGEPRPQGNGYDLGADETGLIAIKQATPDPAQPGGQLIYTIHVTNTSNMDLHATITDTLPAHVIPTGVLIWTPTITAPGGAWEHTFAVTVELGYTGPLTNLVEVTTDEGATGRAIVIVNAYKIYLPCVMRNSP